MLLRKQVQAGVVAEICLGMEACGREPGMRVSSGFRDVAAMHSDTVLGTPPD